MSGRPVLLAEEVAYRDALDEGSNGGTILSNGMIREDNTLFDTRRPVVVAFVLLR